MIFREKCFWCYILLKDQFHCLIGFTSWHYFLYFFFSLFNYWSIFLFINKIYITHCFINLLIYLFFLQHMSVKLDGSEQNLPYLQSPKSKSSQWRLVSIIGVANSHIGQSNQDGPSKIYGRQAFACISLTLIYSVQGKWFNVDLMCTDLKHLKLEERISNRIAIICQVFGQVIFASTGCSYYFGPCLCFTIFHVVLLDFAKILMFSTNAILYSSLIF